MSKLRKVKFYHIYSLSLLLLIGLFVSACSDDFAESPLNSLGRVDEGYAHYAIVRVKNVSQDPHNDVAVRYTDGNSSTINLVQAGTYDSTNELYTFSKIVPVSSFITLKEIDLGSLCYKLNKKIDFTKDEYAVVILNYANFVPKEPESINYSISVSGLASKPNSAKVYYKVDGSSTERTVDLVYDSANKRAKATFSAEGKVTITKVLINNRSYTQITNLDSATTSKSIAYNDMSANTCTIVIKDAPKSSLLKITYRGYNSKTKTYHTSTYSASKAVYSNAGNYWFNLTPSVLDQVNYDKIQIRKVILDNATLNAESYYVGAGGKITVAYSKFTKNNTKYGVNVFGDWSKIFGATGTMNYEINGTKYTAKGTVKHVPNVGYCMHFETVNTKENNVHISSVKVGNALYKYGFTMKYNQNASSSNANEGINTRNLNLDTNFKAGVVTYTVTISGVSSGGTLKWGTGSNAGTSKSLSYDSSTKKATATISSSADNVNIGTINIDSKKSSTLVKLTPTSPNLNLSYSQFGKKGNKWVTKTCSCTNGKCPTCNGTKQVTCGTTVQVGGKKCYWCNNTKTTKCVQCNATGKHQECSGSGTKRVLTAVN